MRSGHNPLRSEPRRRVVVAMSGGVDSSVAAALLKKQGCDVIGVFMKFWQPPLRRGTRICGDNNADLRRYENRCCSSESEKMARQVAKKLDIPFYVINAEKEFKKKVVDHFLKKYKNGLTPNPCVVCNKEIKFGFLIEKALKLGAGFVATGHYARLRREIPNSKFQITNYKLLKAKDKNKDQSYFLWQLGQKQLSRILFPVGGYAKPQVRALAKKFKLPVAETPESQEVCFIENTTNEFLRRYLKTKLGKIIDKNRKILGQHQGLWFYTIGQRKGIGLSGGPHFVVAKDFKNNNLIVSKDKKDLLRKELIAKNVNWILPQKLPINAEIKIRYRSAFAKAKIFNFRNVRKSRDGAICGHGRVKIIFEKLQRAVTSGQSVVFYKGEDLLGGGVIK